MSQDTVILMAARASRVENQDAIDTAIVGMLADPKEVNPIYLFKFLAAYEKNVKKLVFLLLAYSLFIKGSCRYSRGKFSAI